MKINCLHCGHRFELDDAYSDYEGAVRCPVCGGMSRLRIQDGLVKAAEPMADMVAPRPIQPISVAGVNAQPEQREAA